MKRILSIILASVSFGVMAQQVPVSTSSEKKNVVIEDFTGVYCGWCPDGARIADNLRNASGGKFCVMAVQCGYLSGGGLEIQEGTILEGLLKTEYVGYPCGAINRRKWSGQTYVPHSRSYWTNNAATMAGEDSPVNIGANAYFKTGSNDVEIEVTTYNTSSASNMFVNVAILQDSILEVQDDYHVGGNSSNPLLYPERRDASTGKFWHMDVLRDMVTPFTPPTTFGDALTNTASSDYNDFSYTWTIPNSIGGHSVVRKDLHVVVYVTQGTALASAEIMNAIDIPVLERPLGVSEIEAVNNIEIFPNPFVSEATVRLNINEPTNMAVKVVDVTGKVVFNIANKNYAVGTHNITLDGSDLPGGLYYVNLQSDEQLITRKLVLNK